MTTIQYISPPAWAIQTLGDAFGRVYLDVSTDFDIRLTKALDALDEIEQISQEAALSGSLPATNRNRALLEQFRGDVVNRNRDVINVEVIQDGEVLPLNGAAVLGYDNGEYEFELFGDVWIDELERITLRDLPLPDFVYNKTNVIAAWNDRDSLAIPGLAHYGAWNTPGDVKLEDLRFWFNVGQLLTEALSAVGWRFISPHYSQGDGQYLFAYLSATNWHWYEGKTDLRFVQLNIASPRAQIADVDFTLFDEVYDPNDIYNNIFFPGRYIYAGADPNVVVDIRFQFRNFEVVLPPPPPGETAYTFVFGIRKVDSGISKYVHTEFVTGSADQTVTKVLNFDYIDQDATGTDSYDFLMFYQNLQTENYLAYTLNSCDVYIRPDQAKYTTGDTIALGDLLSNEITCKDFFQAAAQLINGKILTDHVTKTVYLYPPYTYTKQDASGVIEGFYLRDLPPIDLRANTISQAWDDDNRDRDRYRVYKFADSSDAYLKNDDYFSRRVDLGSGLPKEKTIENPLFEATGEILATAAEVGGSGIYMPALWDNDEGDLSSEIGPRLAIYYGLIGQSGLTWSFDGTGEVLTPYLAQVAGIELPGTVEFVPVTYSGFVRDLYVMFYQREVESPALDVAYKLILTGGNETYRVIDFRRTVLIRGEDADLEMQPTAVRDHVAGQSRVPLLVEARLI